MCRCVIINDVLCSLVVTEGSIYQGPINQNRSSFYDSRIFGRHVFRLMTQGIRERRNWEKFLVCKFQNVQEMLIDQRKKEAQSNGKGKY